ncbi:unknown protein [Seminavis robusta]|uniref:Ankyrin n=1 Tax=Seminavis robusta TaxID=568900 RepID=A0A9N8ENR6_9STRA|nr:unknown protein [Seminavis robusta]|eukprot:Sro1297_g260530.1 n/a (236) ;mRNA; f:24964-25671
MTPFAVIQCLVELNPRALETPSNEGRLPLHEACRLPQTPLATIQYLAQQSPQALQTPNNFGSLPLHEACRNSQTHLATIHYLAQQSPQALRVSNNRGLLPLVAANIDGMHSMRVLVSLVRVDPGVMQTLRTELSGVNWNQGRLRDTLDKLAVAANLAVQEQELTIELRPDWMNETRDNLETIEDHDGQLHPCIRVLVQWLRSNIIDRNNYWQDQLDPIAARPDALAGDDTATTTE